MLENYIARIRKAEEGKGPQGEKGKRGYETLALLAHEELTALYKKVGFRVQCVSHIQYGSGQWLEMRRSVYPSPSSGPASRIDSALARTTSATSSGSDEAPAGLKMSTTAAAALLSKQEPESSAVSTPKAGESKASVAHEAKAVAATPNPTSPPGMPSQASIMAALAAQSQPGKNPGQTYTSILGQAVAAKTPAEDAGLALEARLVDRENGTNLAKLYCPMENCRCCILARGAGEWTRKESGPLCNPELELPNSPSPPQGPAFPVHSASPGITNRLLTTVKGFWMVAGPLQFDNVGFSRDMKWTVPTGNDSSTPVLGASASGNNSMSSSVELTAPRTKAQDKEAREKQKREEKERQREEKERRKKEKRDRKRGGSGSDSSDEDIGSLLSHLSLGLTPGEELTVKYLLCPDCECGPLGFTILPAEMQGGRLAAEVGDQVERMKGGTMGMEGAAPKRSPQMFYLAADRVRYQFERS